MLANKINSRQPDLYDESPASSEYSTGSTVMSHTAGDQTEHIRAEIGALDRDIGPGSQLIHVEEDSCVGECEKGMPCGGTGEQGSELSYDMPRLISFSLVAVFY